MPADKDSPWPPPYGIKNCELFLLNEPLKKAQEMLGLRTIESMQSNKMNLSGLTLPIFPNDGRSCCRHHHHRFATTRNFVNIN